MGEEVFLGGCVGKRRLLLLHFCRKGGGNGYLVFIWNHQGEVVDSSLSGKGKNPFVTRAFNSRGGGKEKRGDRPAQDFFKKKETQITASDWESRCNSGRKKKKKIGLEGLRNRVALYQGRGGPLLVGQRKSLRP